MRYEESRKKELVLRYYNGISVSDICQENQIPRSTFYGWIKAYLPAKEGGCKRKVTPKMYDSLLRHCRKQERMVAALKACKCPVSASTQEKLKEMERLYGQFSVHVLCDAMNVPRGTFYNHIKRNKRDDNHNARHRKELREAIQHIFDESRQTFGCEKMCAVLHDRGYRAGTTLVRELMKEMGLHSVSTTAKQQWIKKNDYTRKPNVLRRAFHIEEPNLVWVSDITYLSVKNRRYYLCVIIDLYARKVIAYRISTRMSTQLVTATFKAAFANRAPNEKMVFHSDQGSQYTSRAFRQMLNELGVIQSFSKTGTPYDNAVRAM